VTLPFLISITTALNIGQILISIVLVGILLLQAKGSGFGAALGGSTGSMFRTRRGVEKTLFQLTIILVIVFILISMWAVRASPRGA
jgi:preprotein translocase subunit SecG